MKSSVLRFLIAGIVLATMLQAGTGCKSRSERKKQQAEMERIRKDSVKPAVNPYKAGPGVDGYNRQREALGNLDSVATPAVPPAPRR